MSATQKSWTKVNLTTNTVASLRELAKQRWPKLKLPSGLRKAELVDYLLALQAEEKLPAPVFAHPNELPLVPGHVTGDIWQHLDEHGWTVIPGVASIAESEAAKQEFFSFLESCHCEGLPDWQRNDPKTWKNLTPNLHGIVKHYVGYTAFMWRMRMLAKPHFAQLWGTENLVSSFDGACFIPPQPVNPDTISKDRVPLPQKWTSWMHLDQGRVGNGERISVQGLICLSNSGPADGGLVVVDKSHTQFQDYLAKHPSFGYKGYGAVDARWFSGVPMKVCANVGDLILWDSRTVHCNIAPVALKKNATNCRVCAYVCWQKRDCLTPQDRSKRQRFLERREMTGHWCYGPGLHGNGVHAFTPGRPQYRPDEIPYAEPPAGCV